MLPAVAAPAYACTCLIHMLEPRYPADGATGVPIDAVVYARLFLPDEDEVGLWDEAAGVRLDAERVDGDDGQVWLWPTTPLPAETTIRVALDDDSEWFTFETGTGAATPVEQAPDLVVDDVVSESRLFADSCGTSRYVALTASGVDAAWFELEVREDEETTMLGSEDGTLWVGRYPCGGTYDIDAFEDLRFRARGVAADGEPGPWSEVVTVDACGCGTAARPEALAVLVAGAFVRRRRPTVRAG